MHLFNEILKLKRNQDQGREIIALQEPKYLPMLIQKLREDCLDILTSWSHSTQRIIQNFNYYDPNIFKPNFDVE